MNEKESVKKIAIIVSKNTLEDVYAGLVMANGAVMDGIETIMFFTFFGLDAITKNAVVKATIAFRFFLVYWCSLPALSTITSIPRTFVFSKNANIRVNTSKKGNKMS